MMKMLTISQVKKVSSREEAIRLSIQHHEELADCSIEDLESNYLRFGIGPVSSDLCALCRLYLNPGTDITMILPCENCPLFSVNGGQGCSSVGTAWYSCFRSFRDFHSYLKMDREGVGKKFAEWQERERNMVKVLKSLLEDHEDD